MAPPVMGDRSTCSDCHRLITYVGPYWRHDGDWQPRHIATPMEMERPTEGSSSATLTLEEMLAHPMLERLEVYSSTLKGRERTHLTVCVTTRVERAKLLATEAARDPAALAAAFRMIREAFRSVTGGA